MQRHLLLPRVAWSGMLHHRMTGARLREAISVSTWWMALFKMVSLLRMEPPCLMQPDRT